MAQSIQAFARRAGLPIDSMEVALSEETAPAPSRMSKVKVHIHLKGNIGPEDGERLSRIPHHCKIHNTLVRPPIIEVDWDWEE